MAHGAGLGSLYSLRREGRRRGGLGPRAVRQRRVEGDTQGCQTARAHGKA